MRNGIEIGLLPRGDPYREPRGQSEYGERAGEVLGRGVLVKHNTQKKQNKTAEKYKTNLNKLFKKCYTSSKRSV